MVDVFQKKNIHTSNEESIIASDVPSSSALIDASKESSLLSSFLDEILKVPKKAFQSNWPNCTWKLNIFHPYTAV